MKIYEYIYGGVIFGVLYPYLSKAILNQELGELISLMEMFVLIAATLAVLSFTYALVINIKRDKQIIILTGEVFFVSAAQFIVGLVIMHLISGPFRSLNLLSIDWGINWITLKTFFIFLGGGFAASDLITSISKFGDGVARIYCFFKERGKFF